MKDDADKAMHIFISAGEVSGDLHGAALIRALRSLYPECRISAVAGPQMRAQGCSVVEHMESLNVMGLGDVIKALPRIRRIGENIQTWLVQAQPDVVVLIDFPGFHMRLGQKIRKLNMPVIQYIAPKLWAWGSWRIKRLQQSQDRLACILPFEPDWFARFSITGCYVGNPSALACREGWSTEAFRQHIGVSDDTKVLALLPGSRAGELARHATLLADSFTILQQNIPGLIGITPRAPGVSDAQLAPLIEAGVQCIDRMQDGYALRADAAIAVSGTATLELALWDVPTVLVYRNTPMMIWLARKLVGTRCAGLANILLDDQEVMPELIQEFATVENIVEKTRSLLRDSQIADQQRQLFSALRQRLGTTNPSEQVAHLCMELAKKS